MESTDDISGPHTHQWRIICFLNSLVSCFPDLVPAVMAPHDLLNKKREIMKFNKISLFFTFAKIL